MTLKRKISFFIITIIIVGMLLPQKFTIPVDGATKTSYNSKSFWFYPWGKSGTHKGVDIFAQEGTTVRSSTGGLVIYCGEISMGGNIVLVIGPKWRLHYYAHLQKTKTSLFSWLHSGSVIGTVGSTGNAAGKPPHLHYSIMTIIPYFWQVDRGIQGWKKMFYINPINYMEER